MTDLIKGGLATLGVLFAVMVVVTFVFGNRSEPDFSRVEEALNMVPLSVGIVPFTTQPIEFADYSGARRVAGLGQAVGLQAYLGLPEDDRRSLYQGLPKPGAGLRDREAELLEILAIDLYGFDIGVWVTQQDLLVRNFMVLQGIYEKEEIANKLLELGYKEAQHGNAKFYRLFEEPKLFEEVQFTGLGHPLDIMAPHVNRVAFLGDKLLLGSNDFVIKALIDVQLGKSPSLRDDRGYIRLARGSGSEVLGGVFLDHGWLQNTWDRIPEQDLAVPESWESLASYRLVLLGYRQTGESGETVVAFIRVQISSAERSVEELEKRWNTFHVQTSSGAVPVSSFCSPFSTSVIERKDKRPSSAAGFVNSGTREYSVLTGTCQIVEIAGPDVAFQGAGLWRTLYETGQLIFLVEDA